MKKQIFVLIGLLLSPFLLRAQDKILLQNGNELQAKVLEITQDSVHFTAADSIGTQSLSKESIFLIRFQNNTYEVFSKPKPVAEKEIVYSTHASNTPYSSQMLNELGRRDAKLYFKAGGTFWASYGATLGGFMFTGPIIGAGTGLACTLSPPPTHNIIASDPNLKTDPDYLNGYIRQAKMKKLGNAAGGVAAGTGTAVVLIGYLFFLAFQ